MDRTNNSSTSSSQSKQQFYSACDAKTRLVLNYMARGK